MGQITLTINNQQVRGNQGDTILEVSRNYGIPIPTLCHDPCLKSYGACRVCLVEDTQRGSLHASCVTPISPGLAIKTDSEAVINARKVVVKLMLANHPESCLVCEKGNRCKLRQIAADLGIGYIEYYPMPSFTGTQELNPFILRDLSKCILCAKCIRADHELVVEGAIDYMDRGFEARPATLSDGPLDTSECTFCGTCVEMCPTGALFEKDKPFRGSAKKRVATTCSFCGCGCSLFLDVCDNRVTGARPGVQGSLNNMTLCARGHYGNDFIHHPQRLLKPMIGRDGRLAEAAWEEAISAASDGFQKVLKEKGPSAVAIIAGPHITNEDAYAIQRFSSEILKSDNLAGTAFESSGNLITGIEESLGRFCPGSIEDLDGAEAIMVIGANPTETAPIVGYGIKRAARYGEASLIVVDPVKTKLTKYASLWVRPAIQTDQYILAGLMEAMIKQKDLRKKPSESALKQIKEIEKKLKSLQLKDIEKITGVSPQTISAAASMFLSAGKRSLVIGNGIAQQENGAELVRTACTLASLADLLSRGKTNILPILYQSNALGSYQMGIGATSVKSIMENIHKGTIKALWVIGDDPATSLPFLPDVDRSIASLDFLAVSASFPSGIGERADVVFPAATFAEKSGTVTNMEGRLQRVNKAIDCAGESLPDWRIITMVAEHMGHPLSYRSEGDIFREIQKALPHYAEVKLPKDPGRYISHRLAIEKKRGIPAFVPDTLAPPPGTDSSYPYLMMLSSLLFQLGAGHQTGHSARLEGATGPPFIDINPDDAAEIGIRNDDTVKLTSPSDEITIKARINKELPPGVVVMPRPFARGTSLLSRPLKDGLKSCRIKIERIS